MSVGVRCGGAAAVPRRCSCRAGVILVLLASACLRAASAAYSAEPPVEADVCVYGGSPAGVTSAIQVARMGRRVVLVEPSQHVGGMLVEGLGGTSDVNNHNFRNDVAIGGLAREYFQRIGRHYGRGGPQYSFEPHVAEQVIAQWLAEHQVEIHRGQRLAEPLEQSVQKDASGRIVAIQMESGRRFRAAVFIDATVEGDLLAAAGVTTVIGREGNAAYGETLNGIRGENTYRQFAVKVDPYVIPGDPASGLIATIQDEPLGTPGEGDHRIMAYCFRMCLTDRPENRIPFSQPPGYDRSQYEIYLRYLQAGGKLFRPSVGVPNRKTDLGSWHDLSANLYGMNHEYPGGDYATRERIYLEHLRFTQGLVYFLANDPEVPESTRRAWSPWGVCKDEFTDNGGWPRRLYVRSARRMKSDYVITEHHTRRINATPVADPVGVAYWPPDGHHVRRIVRDGAAYNEGFVFGGDQWGPFGISYRALVPRAAECANLITPTCPSSSYVGYNALRLEWTFMVLGQSAGTAAVLAIEAGVSVQQVAYGALRARLLADGQVLGLNLVPPK